MPTRLVLLTLLASASAASAQLSITWSTIDSGGSTTLSAGQFTLSATIGQPDAPASSAPIAAGPFTLYPGFWSPAIAPPCDPDTNQDGVSDQGDVDYLINVIAGGPNPTNTNPDFNNDGVADQGDIDTLINIIAGGPCP